MKTESKRPDVADRNGELALDLVDRLGRLYSAVVSDALDHLGFRQQVMSPRIRPLHRRFRIAGRAVTIWIGPAGPRWGEAPHAGEIAVVDSLAAGDVVVASHCQAALWGELLATAARVRGCPGVVIDGYARDAAKLIHMKFPCFVKGIDMRDSLGRTEIKAQNVPIHCGGVRVQPGDLILADFDGVIVVPYAAAEAVISWGEEKVRREGTVRMELLKGMSVTEVFSRHGTL